MSRRGAGLRSKQEICTKIQDSEQWHLGRFAHGEREGADEST
jgi:hypothetical protein